MIVIVDYGMGNLGSIANMLKKIGTSAIISSDLDVIAQAHKLILPGVGAFDHGMTKVKELGILTVLNERVLNAGVPVLGICLGMQLMTHRSDEGELPGLGWIEADTVRFHFGPDRTDLKIPHMGWNQLTVRQSHQLLAGLEPENRFYFVHSYHVVCTNPGNILAQTTYGFDFTSVVARGNVMGVQFHPEKSHKFGMRLLKNFVESF
ncbi:MAG: imidazole glycerol phosphate synthase subunit HisH [Thermodesulfobacteriota bacterium]